MGMITIAGGILLALVVLWLLSCAVGGVIAMIDRWHCADNMTRFWVGFLAVLGAAGLLVTGFLAIS